MRAVASLAAVPRARVRGVWALLSSSPRVLEFQVCTQIVLARYKVRCRTLASCLGARLRATVDEWEGLHECGGATAVLANPRSVNPVGVE